MKWRCENCKHWKRTRGIPESAAYRECKANWVDHVVELNGDVNLRCNAAMLESIGMRDSSGHVDDERDPQLLTMPRFGCVRFESKEGGQDE